MDKLCSKNLCSGCAACQAVCKHRAIKMAEDVYGFSYPIIEETKCKNCGACTKACPQMNAQQGVTPFTSYACHAIDPITREESSSGGFATLLAKYFIKNGGIVYGCAFVPPMGFRHIKCETIKDADKLRGSKYVQSHVHDVYPSIKNDIKQQKKVLFIGTPCQVAGVKSVFGKYNDLFVVDLVCHGVPSVKFLCDTLPVDVRNCDKTQVEFRASTKFHFSVKSGISLIYDRPIEKDIFFKGFFTGVLFRPSCFSCKYAQKERISDITIGDFWRLKSNKITDTSKGVSLVLVNNEKGRTLFYQVKSCMTVDERPLEEAFNGNEQLNHPFRRGVREHLFKWLYPYMGLKKSLWIVMPDRLLGTKVKTLINKIK